MFLPNSTVTITSLISDQPLIGVDPIQSETRPVISDGQDTVWDIQARFAEDGIRAVIMMGDTIAIPNDDKVIVAPIPDVMPPPPRFEWILKPGPTPEVQYWSIINPANGLAWTLNSSTPKTQIDLDRLEDDIPDSQKFQTTAVNN